MAKNLTKNDWLRAARLALLKGGVGDVRVDALARNLGVTKGSFYWHFGGHDELLEALLREWEEELREILTHLKHKKTSRPLIALVQELADRARLSEEGLSPSDAAIFSWAATSAEVARRVNRVEEQRMKLLKRMIPDAGRAELFYLIWLGFVSRGQREPASRVCFIEVARTALKLLRPAERGSRRRRPIRRSMRA